MLIITEKIKNILKNKNLTQYKLAKLINYDHGGLGGYIRGKRPFPDDIIPKIAPILEVSPETIKGWIIADKYPKDVLKNALKIKQEQAGKEESVFAAKVNGLMRAANLNIMEFSEAIRYNQGWFSQMRLGKKPVSDLAIQKLSAYSGIPKDEIKCWTVADKYSLEALQTALAV